MSVVELFEHYKLQDQNNCNARGNHMDIGPGHFDYPHQDGHTDEA